MDTTVVTKEADPVQGIVAKVVAEMTQEAEGVVTVAVAEAAATEIVEVASESKVADTLLTVAMTTRRHSLRSTFPDSNAKQGKVTFWTRLKSSEI